MASSHSDIGLRAPSSSSSSFFFFFLLLQTIILPANSISFNFTGFNEHEEDLNREGEAMVVRTDIPITASNKIYNNSVGRVMYHRQMRLWDPTTPSRTLTDFTTTFSFIISSDQTYYADGLAFFLAHPDIPPLITNISLGGGLGIGPVDGNQVLNSTKHPFVAVEFDTFHNPWDPDTYGSHVGININSMKSVETRPWFPDIKDMKRYRCTVKYNSSTLRLTVSFTNGNGNNSARGNAAKTSFSYKVDLRDYLPEYVIFGFSAATGEYFEVHILQSWSFNSTLEATPRSQRRGKVLLFIGLGSGIGLSSTFLSFICILLWKRIKAKKEAKASSSPYDIQNMDDEFITGTGPKSFCYNALKEATHNFSESKKLGQGGFGAVYKGYLKELNSLVAIKRISRDSLQGIKEYATEVKVISQLRHKNLVQLLGWCHKKNDLLLVYEYMQNGSLDSYLSNNNNNTKKKPKPNKLTWEARYNIALGLASAILYLHEEWSRCVLHRDIKSSNVMLDSSFNAKLGDFGLARLVSHDKGARTTLLAGTRGYIAPEYVFTGKTYKESDTYSYGVVLLEIASGRKAIDISDNVESETVISVVEWVWELYGKGRVGEAADPNLGGEYEEEEMERMLVVGLWCTYPDYLMRPNMREVIKVLNFEAPLPAIPLTMPVPMYLPPSIKAMFTSLEASFWAKC